ncbi:MAG: hypothetical protein AB7T07_15155 [Steroidobacteraceae bacterium]
MIEHELKRLGAMQCLPLIEHITRNFLGFPLDGENSDPAFQLLTRLQQLQPPVKSRDIHKAISTLDAFSWRAYVVTSVRATPIYWNPLEMPWVNFHPRRQKTILQVEWEYPPPDIIMHYCECLQSELKDA